MAAPAGGRAAGLARNKWNLRAAIARKSPRCKWRADAASGAPNGPPQWSAAAAAAVASPCCSGGVGQTVIVVMIITRRATRGALAGGRVAGACRRADERDAAVARPPKWLRPAAAGRPRDKQASERTPEARQIRTIA